MLQVNNNGHISFNQPFSVFDPEPFPINIPLISPYWADADTRPEDGGIVWYRETTSQVDKSRVQGEIGAIFMNTGFIPNVVFIATWYRVGFYPFRTDKVTIKSV